MPDSRVDDDAPTKESDEGPPAPELSARTRRRTGRESAKENFPPHARPKRRGRRAGPSTLASPNRRESPVIERTAPVRPFYNPRMQISGSQKPGGRSHARPLVGRKGGVYLPGSRHLHTRFSLSLDERLGGSENPPPFSAMTGVRRKEKNGVVLFCGCRKMAGVRCWRGSKMAVDAMLARWSRWFLCGWRGVVVFGGGPK